MVEKYNIIIVDNVKQYSRIAKQYILLKKTSMSLPYNKNSKQNLKNIKWLEERSSENVIMSKIVLKPSGHKSIRSRGNSDVEVKTSKLKYIVRYYKVTLISQHYKWGKVSI